MARHLRRPVAAKREAETLRSPTWRRSISYDPGKFGPANP
jgi:hypothetical protein